MAFWFLRSDRVGARLDLGGRVGSTRVTNILADVFQGTKPLTDNHCPPAVARDTLRMEGRLAVPISHRSMSLTPSQL